MKAAICSQFYPRSNFANIRFFDDERLMAPGRLVHRRHYGFDDCGAPAISVYGVSPYHSAVLICLNLAIGFVAASICTGVFPPQRPPG